ncbi:MAG TPA: glycosyltransferase [Gaiellaceae bacterium]|jgi:glycosyltransferase involved in cell wall biosynthesis
MSDPLVSVIVPALNGARFLGEALDSIREQSYKRWEVLLVDGGSTDRTLEIASRFDRVRTISQLGSGLAGAWNEGLAAAEGELIAFLDSDDRWLRDKLSRQVALLAADPSIDCAIARVRFVLEPGLPIPSGFRPELLEGDHVANMPSALLARRSVFERIGDFDTRWRIAMDIDWFARLKDAGLRTELVPEVMLEKRVHDANLSILGGATLNLELVELLRESVARRRGTA